MKILWPVWHTSLETANLRTVIIVFRSIASIKTTFYLRIIQTSQLKAAVDLRIKCDGHILKRYFPSVSLIILPLYWIFILKNSLNRHDYMYQTQIHPETSQRKWDKLRKFYRPNSLLGYPSDQCVNCDQLLLSALFGFYKAQYRYRQTYSWFFMCK